MDHNGFRQGGNSSPRDSRSAQNSLGSRHPERGRGNSFHSKPYYLKPTLGPPWVTGPPPKIKPFYVMANPQFLGL